MADSIDGAASRKCAMLIINPISGTGNKKERARNGCGAVEGIRI